ncbi:hypothetical protein BC937DRAFT_90257 [Endogone sp. FLAS-F59071]|nr:hypothetical protein BC937DRAFT_90257 [Endogone sp. FLAS-F59071]|eukprot:RUS17213.1 hypothetical protein BC937DRAFT_90257 [Endogone sp. FLAS-F59071]
MMSIRLGLAYPVDPLRLKLNESAQPLSLTIYYRMAPNLAFIRGALSRNRLVLAHVYRRNYTPSFPRHAAKPSPLTAVQTQPQTLITAPEKTAVEPPPAKQPFSITGLFQKSKELFVFYKNGVKLLLGNRKTVKELKEAQRKGQVWNRREFQMVHTTEEDMRKLIPFGIFLAILPEAVSLFLSNDLYPGTSTQYLLDAIAAAAVAMNNSDFIIIQESMRRKVFKKRLEMSQNIIKSSSNISGIAKEDFSSVNGIVRLDKRYQLDFEFEHIDKKHLAAYCSFMGVNHWLATHGMLKKRLTKRLNYLLQDDLLISNEGVNLLTLEELQKAVEERGMRSLDASETHLRRSLQVWLNLRLHNPPITPGLVIFSRMFGYMFNYDK